MIEQVILLIGPEPGTLTALSHPELGEFVPFWTKQEQAEKACEAMAKAKNRTMHVWTARVRADRSEGDGG